MNRHITWDEMFMGVAEICAARSKDPSRKVGACIVKDGKIISTGYNGMPKVDIFSGNNDDFYTWDKDKEDKADNKYAYVVHAEMNAILNSSQLVRGSILYVTDFPCNECAKAIVQSGIKVVFFRDKPERDYNEISEKILNGAGVEFYQHYSEVKATIIEKE